MISKESAKYAISNLKKRKARSLLTIISILVGIATIFIFVSFGLGIYNYVNSFVTGSTADKITIMPKGSGIPGLDQTFALIDSDVRAIERTSGVYEAEGMKWGVTEIYQTGTRKYAFVMGYNPEQTMMLEWGSMQIEKGRELTKDDKDKVVLGYNYMFDNKILPKSLDLNDKIRINGKDFIVVGFFESIGNPQDDINIYLTEESFSELFPEIEGYGMIIARGDISNLDRVVENIEKSLRKSRNLEEGKEDFTVSSFKDMLESYTSALDIIVAFIILIALISVLVSAINTANTMVTSVLERTKEIGVMKSIGARNSEIFKLFLFESGLLGFLAGVLGVALGASLAFIGEKILFELGYGFLKPYYSIWLFAGCILFATITGAISGIFPALNAAKTNPVKALRYE